MSKYTHQRTPDTGWPAWVVCLVELALALVLYWSVSHWVGEVYRAK